MRYPALALSVFLLLGVLINPAPGLCSQSTAQPLDQAPGLASPPPGLLPAADSLPARPVETAALSRTNDIIANHSLAAEGPGPFPDEPLNTVALADSGQEEGDAAPLADSPLSDGSATKARQTAETARTDAKVQEAGELSLEHVAEISIDDLGSPLGYPSALFYDPRAEELYIVNGRDGRIVIAGADYIPSLSLGAGRGIEIATAVALDQAGDVYVCQQQTATQAARLTILNGAFFVEREIVFEQYPEISKAFSPLRVAVSPAGLIYVAGNVPGVLVFNRQGELLQQLIPEASGEAKKLLYGKGEGPSIRDVAIDSRGQIYLLSEEISQVFVYSEKGELLLTLGEKGGSTGKLSRPRGVAVDEKRGLVYVVDYMRHTILVYNESGRYLTEFGGWGVGPGWFNYPTDIKVGRQGQVIVADFFNNRVQVLETKFKSAAFAR